MPANRVVPQNARNSAADITQSGWTKFAAIAGRAVAAAFRIARSIASISADPPFPL
jgi:hypothetical protein